MEYWGWIILAIVNAPVYWLIGWLVFDTWDEFWECVKYWLMPDIVSWFRGEALDDMWAEMKLFIFALMCAGVVFGEGWLLSTYVLGDTA